MFAKRVLLLCLTLCTLSVAAQAALANLVRQYAGTTATGQAVLVCVYEAEGRQFERQYPPSNFCPAYAET